MDSVSKSLTAQTKRTEELEGQVKQSQHRVVEAQAAAAAAQVDLKSAEQKVAELVNSLDTAKLSRKQAIEELQQQHTDQTQVEQGTCCTSCLLTSADLMHCPVILCRSSLIIWSVTASAFCFERRNCLCCAIYAASNSLTITVYSAVSAQNVCWLCKCSNLDVSSVAPGCCHLIAQQRSVL